MQAIAIKDALSQVMRRLENKQGQASALDPQVWIGEVFNKKEAMHVKFGYLKKGVLGLVVDSSAWIYALNLKKEGLVADLRKKNAQIKEIHFRLGDVDEKRKSR